MGFEPRPLTLVDVQARDDDAPLLRNSTCKTTVTLKPRLGSLKVIKNDTIRSTSYDFLSSY